MRIDHVVLGVRDLVETAERLHADYGLGSEAGGVHVGWGTGNRIVPVGDQYLELLGVVDHAEAEGNEFGRSVLDAVAEGDRFIGWCLRADDIDAVATRLGLVVTSGGRTRPDGVTVRWRSAGLEQAIAEPSLPFFIEWEDMSAHPSRMPVSHRVDATEIARIEVGGDERRLRDWLDGLPLPVRLTGGPPQISRVTLTTGTGEISLGL